MKCVREIRSLVLLAVFTFVSAAQALPVDISFHDSFSSQHDHMMITGHAYQDIQKRSFPTLEAKLSNYSISKVKTLLNSGPANNRVNLVLEGDGFSSKELAAYHDAVNKILAEFFRNDEIFAQYKSYFNVHVLDLVSEASETGAASFPLDSTFDCGTSRLLCVNTVKAWEASSAAPGADQVMVLSRNSEYGGAGYPNSKVAVVAALNEFAAQIINHEFGHSFANLADEYVANGAVYSGSELSFPNVSILNSGSMQESKEKWFRWLGAFDPFTKSTIGTYEGAAYKTQGMFRATPDSKMRTLGKPFNLPSVEAIIMKIYEKVSLIDSVTIKKDKVVVSGPVTKSLKIDWQGGKAGQACSNMRSCSVRNILGNSNAVSFSVKVSDQTSLVRYEEFRDSNMTSHVKFRLRVRPNGKVVLTTLES